METRRKKTVTAGDIVLGSGNPLVLIAGPCVIVEDIQTRTLAARLQEIAAKIGMPLIFKASYDKANRTSLHSFRGPGIDQGLRILDRIKSELHLPVLSDIHRFEEIKPAAQVLDVLQVPAFLCRQTDFVVDVARAASAVNIKKGQFLSPNDMMPVIEKIQHAGNENVLVTERGASFGYNNLVADMRSLVILRKTGYPVVFDATHSVQLPGGHGTSSGGEREFVEPLARAAVAVGIDALFLEVYENPDDAPCDGPNAVRLSELPGLLRRIRALEAAISEQSG